MRTTTLLFVATLLSVATIVEAQSLEGYLKEAAENNPGLKAKYAEFEASMQRVAHVGALPDPQLSFGLFISPVETRVGPQQAKIGLSQMFPWYGTLSAKKDVARFMADAKYQIFLQEKNELFFKVKSAWYPLYELNGILKLQKENMDILYSYKNLSTSHFKNGKGSMVDVIRVDIHIENAETEIELLEDKMKPLWIQFNKLLNRGDSATVVISDSLIFVSVDANYRRDSLLINHPMLTAMDLRIQSAIAQERMARKNGLPKMGVGLDYVLVGERTDMQVAENGKDVLMPMVSISLPIFRGKYKAATKEAQFTQAAYASSKEDFQNNLISMYEMTFYELNSARTLIELNASLKIKTKQVIHLLLSAYSNSGKDFEEVLRMQQMLLKYEIAEVKALNKYFIALAKLDFLTSKSE